MANDSSTGGFLSPAVASPPLEDDALDDLLHDLVAGITGLPGNMVRPRWQPTVPKQPEQSVNWCAIGITAQTPDAGPAFRHDPTGDGHDEYQRHEDIELLCTFYGPAAKGYAQMLVDGLAIPQNNEQLGLNDMRFVSVGTVRAAPDLVNQQWVRRYDVTVALRRKITRTYTVLNLLSAHATTETDSVPRVGGTITIDQ